jgi:hypothetical protein
MPSPNTPTPAEGQPSARRPFVIDSVVILSPLTNEVTGPNVTVSGLCPDTFNGGYVIASFSNGNSRSDSKQASEGFWSVPLGTFLAGTGYAADAKDKAGVLGPDGQSNITVQGGVAGVIVIESINPDRTLTSGAWTVVPEGKFKVDSARELHFALTGWLFPPDNSVEHRDEQPATGRMPDPNGRAGWNIRFTDLPPGRYVLRVTLVRDGMPAVVTSSAFKLDR